MKIEGISASSYNTWSLCEWKYFLSKILNFPDPSGGAALLGTICHEILELYSRLSLVKHDKNSKYWDINYLWKIVHAHYYNKEPLAAEEITEEKIKKVVKGLIALIGGPYTPIRDNTIGVEIAFNIPVEEVGFRLPDGLGWFSIRGRIDRVDRINEDTVEVLDYKSGSAVNWDSPKREKYNPTTLHETVQAKIYHMAAKKLYGESAKNVLVSFIYFTENLIIPAVFCDDDLETTKTLLQRRFQTIAHNKDPQRNLGWHCQRLCSYGRSGICDEIYQERVELGQGFVTNKYSILNQRKPH